MNYNPSTSSQSLLPLHMNSYTHSPCFTYSTRLCPLRRTHDRNRARVNLRCIEDSRRQGDLLLLLSKESNIVHFPPYWTHVLPAPVFTIPPLSSPFLPFPRLPLPCHSTVIPLPFHHARTISPSTPPPFRSPLLSSKCPLVLRECTPRGGYSSCSLTEHACCQ